MNNSRASGHAKRARAAKSIKDKLDNLAKAIEELAADFAAIERELGTIRAQSRLDKPVDNPVRTAPASSSRLPSLKEFRPAARATSEGLPKIE